MAQDVDTVTEEQKRLFEEAKKFLGDGPSVDEALDWFSSLCGVVFAADHIEDGDPHEPFEVPSINFCLTQWARNSFYAENAIALSAVIEGAFKAWHIGNELDSVELQNIGYVQVMCVMFQILNGRPCDSKSAISLWRAYEPVISQNLKEKEEA